MATQLDTRLPRTKPSGISSQPSHSRAPRITVGKLVSAVRSRWLLIVVGLLLTTAAATGAALTLSKKTWEASTTLLYTALPIPESGQSMYTQPDLKTLAGLVNSPELLDAIRDEFKISVPTKALEKNLTVTVPNGTKMLTLTLRWDDGRQTVEIVNRLASDFMARVAELRKSKLNAHLVDFDQALIGLQAKQHAALLAVRSFHQREKLSDYKSDIIAENARTVDLETMLERQHRIESDTLAQMKRMDEHLEEVKAQQLQEAEATKQFDAAVESVTDNRRRQDRIRELIQDERKVMEVQAKLDSKKAELNRVKQLYAKKFASLAQLQEIESQVGVLTAQVKDTVKIRDLLIETEKIDKVVVPAGAKKNVGSPIIQQVLFRKLELELQLTAARHEMGQLETQIRESRARSARIDSLHGEHESLLKKVEAVDTERRALELQISGLKNLSSLKTGEFVVAAPARPSQYPISSTKKSILISTFGLGLFLTFGMVVALEAISLSQGCESRAQRLNLPVLSEIPTEAGAVRHRGLRSLALRLRQSLRESGSVVLFSHVTESGDSAGMLDELASLLALRDERVLILDSRLGHGTHRSGNRLSLVNESWSEDIIGTGPVHEFNSPGLSDYLSFSCNDVDQICTPAEGFGIDRISVGEASLTTEALATHRMSELMTELRRRYSIILVAAPSLLHSVDLQILTAMADGLVAVNDGKISAVSRVRHSIDELQELEAPIVGQVVMALKPSH